MEGKTPTKKGKSIKLRAKTIERLDKIRHKGQTYDGIVSELLDFFENKGEEDIR